MNLSLPRRGLYALTPDHVGDVALLVERVLAAIAGGAVLVQYRDKSASPIEQSERATALVAACHGRGVPLIINDAVELAIASGAAGVHLGRDDGDLSAVRKMLGDKRIIGVSCYDSLSLARDAVAAGADYVAFGSCYVSTTKPNAVRCPPSVLREAAQELSVPIVAIGGITAENAPSVVNAGASLLAVIGALFDASDVSAAAQAFARSFSPTLKS